jgi:hypothetical protein
MLEELKKAKDAVRWLLDNESGKVDMKGLSYWASEVERLRKEIREIL